MNHYLKIILLIAIAGLACTTKVSEWVLLNASADRYMLVYHYSDDIPGAIKLQHTQMEKNITGANLSFVVKKEPGVQKPYYALYYNQRLFFKTDDIREINKLVTSPLREEVSADLMKGNLCVMVYLKSGIAEKDEHGLQIVREALAASPFREIIALKEIDRNSQDEKHLVSLLLNVEDDLKDIREPMLYGVFGRFRVLEPLLAKGITKENIGLMIGFFTADCSCVIKDDLPGMSMLTLTNWNDPSPAKVNPILDSNPDLIHH